MRKGLSQKLRQPLFLSPSGTNWPGSLPEKKTGVQKLARIGKISSGPRVQSGMRQWNKGTLEFTKLSHGAVKSNKIWPICSGEAGLPLVIHLVKSR